mmetsp:Transcript_10692/g.29498  ORF Transcript_10692/g.29498 Transcript_10692/m.29498 type:complete len:201 (-) Transcript_10692:106-708(-)
MMQRCSAEPIRHLQFAIVVDEALEDRLVRSFADQIDDGIAELVAWIGTDPAFEEFRERVRVGAVHGADQMSAEGCQLEGGRYSLVSRLVGLDAIDGVASLFQDAQEDILRCSRCAHDGRTSLLRDSELGLHLSSPGPDRPFFAVDTRQYRWWDRSGRQHHQRLVFRHLHLLLLLMLLMLLLELQLLIFRECIRHRPGCRW